MVAHLRQELVVCGPTRCWRPHPGKGPTDAKHKCGRRGTRRVTLSTGMAANTMDGCSRQRQAQARPLTPRRGAAADAKCRQRPPTPRRSAAVDAKDRRCQTQARLPTPSIDAAVDVNERRGHQHQSLARPSTPRRGADVHAKHRCVRPPEYSSHPSLGLRRPRDTTINLEVAKTNGWTRRWTTPASLSSVLGHCHRSNCSDRPADGRWELRVQRH
jgi:hypothetical protein